MALGWSPYLGANYRHCAVLGVSMPPPHPQARGAAAGNACAPIAVSQRRYSGQGLLCRNSLRSASTLSVPQGGSRRARLLAARVAPDSSAGPVTSPRRGRRKTAQPRAPPPGPGAADAVERDAAGGPSPSNALAAAEDAQREGKAASQRLLGSSGDAGSGSSAGEASGEGAVFLGILRFRKPCLRGTGALRSAFPQQAAAAAVRRAEGDLTTQAVQVYARLPDGQLRPYDVTLCRVGQSSVQMTRTPLLAADLGLSEGDVLPLHQLPDGRVVVGGTAADVGVPHTMRVNFPNRTMAYLSGVVAIRQAFPEQAEAALCGQGPQPVRVYGRLPGGELHPYDLSLRADKTKNRFMHRLANISWLLGDLGLQHGDTLRLCVQPDGRVVLEPTHPRPVDPNAIPLTERDIKQGQVVVPLRLAARLLGEEARSVAEGPGMVLPMRLEGGRGFMGKLRVSRVRTWPQWKATALRRWFVALGASPGNTLRLEKEDEGSASAAEGADVGGPHGPAGGPQVARVGSLVARLVRRREGQEVREGGGGPAEGAVLLGTLRYRNACLRGTGALRSAFPQQAAAAVRRVEGGPTKQAVQLHARLPDGQLRPYDVTLCRVGQSSVQMTRTPLLAADLGLSQGDVLPLYQLPDGRVVVGGTAAAVGV